MLLGLMASLATTSPLHAHHRGFAPPPTPWWNPLVAGCAMLLVALEAWALVRPPLPADTLAAAPSATSAARWLWTWSPLVLLVILGGGYAFAAWTGPAGVVRFYAAGSEPPAADCFAVEVQARQYAWRFAYQGGRRLAGAELHVPADTPACLRLASQDVLHSFEVPQWGLRRDIVPGHPTTVTFRPLRPGRYPLYCAILCGSGSDEMDATLVVEPAGAVDTWVAALPPAPQSKGALP